MEAFYVSDSLENKKGNSGWDSEKYGPFDTESSAEDFARRLASTGYIPLDDERRIVQVLFGTPGCSSNYGGEPRHALYGWYSDDDDENTKHGMGPSEGELDRLLVRDEESAD